MSTATRRVIWSCLALCVGIGFGVGSLRAQAVPVINNPAPNPESPAFRISAEPILTAGGANDDPNYDVRFLGTVEVTPAGRLLVTPSGGGRGMGTMNVQIFAPGGRYERAIGRNGEGPGEFRDIGGLWTMAGDSLAVHDDLLRRITVFDPSGRLARTIPMVPKGLCCFDDWSYLVSQGSPFQRSREVQGPRDSLPWLLGRAGDMAPPRQILVLERGDPPILIAANARSPNGTVIGSLGSYIPFGRVESVQITANEIVYGMPDSYEYRVYTKTGTLARIVRAAAATVPVTRSMIATAREAYGSGCTPEHCPLFKAKFDQIKLPPTEPAYAIILTERNGTVWVRGFTAPGVRRQWWARFDPSGRLLGTLTVPPDRRVVRFTNGHVVLARYDSTDGTTQLAVHRIEPISGR